MKTIRYGQQFIDENDIQAVIDVLNSDFLTCGPAVEKFEKAIAEYTQSKYAIAVCNATAGLHLACLALGLSTEDTLWTSPNTFVASANCALYCGSKVDFVDIDPRTYNLSVSALASKLKQAQKENRLPKVVVPVHFAGMSCDMAEINQLSKEYGFRVIEDASHAVGGKYLGKPVGNCEYADFAVFSLHPVKIITTGEGGVVLTNNTELYEKVKFLRSHGVLRNKHLSDTVGPWYYELIELGYNYRITDLQCALGWSQLTKIENFVKRRHELALRYDQHLQDLPLQRPIYRSADSYSALHLYPILVEENKHGKTRREVFDALVERGIGVNVHYIPVHTQPLYQRMGFKEQDFPQAVDYYTKAISLPMHYGLTDQEQDHIIKSLYEILL
ncbi:MAG: UDP-4-amino-4,6-dideoxy-N-acetyl-beta-L-altrosamine transaminase [Gammaproteobacteria bacterium 39-13]|nr:UDP-4-amino-4,6-dideoxy-N-acetyl-beta-L-altrosamine transaminase [Gammaproteobacteria bacterium]OJV87872.1 MAG: UDP-4-amino-4,6-dideoxy-N-acetyl-beta-L-altrosamine transaminase [Gammaproteobacteria bacterium 39-13]